MKILTSMATQTSGVKKKRRKSLHTERAHARPSTSPLRTAQQSVVPRGCPSPVGPNTGCPPGEMLKNLLFSWLSGVTTRSLCLSAEDAMLRNGPESLEDALDFLKDLLGQPLSEETKDDLIRNIDWLSSAFQNLREENHHLRESLRKTRHVTFSPRVNSIDFHSNIPLYSGSGGMVDVLRKPDPLGHPQGRTPVRRPEPLRSRNSREPPREVKFAKYPPLPAIQPKSSRPRLLRERTYDVLEPVFVKGPLQAEKPKLPELKKISTPRRQEASSPASKVRNTPSSRPVTQLPVPKRNKALEKRSENKREDFNPSTLAPPSDIPTNVFWFPM